VSTATAMSVTVRAVDVYFVGVFAMSDNPQPPPSRWRRRLVYLGLIGLTAGATVLGMMFLESIRERKQEAHQVVFAVTNIDETTEDPEVWGKNFPRQYDSYNRTVDIERTRHGGSEAFQKLDTDPVWRTLFKGYAFSIDYREERGHAYMLSDQRETERVTKKAQPGSCLQCHASNVVAYRKAGLEAGAPGALTDSLTSEAGMAQLMTGFDKVNPEPYLEATKRVSHPIACIDCHDPATMAVRVTRPGFIRGIRVLAESADPVPHLPSIERWRKGDRKVAYDPNAEASRQEMRSLVCGQCHVEYYFKGDQKEVTYPWHRGFKVEQIESYYDEVGWKDWVHPDSGASVLKAQHPEMELWSQGIHARSGVSCADCHMPYTRDGAIKVTDHHVRSPMLNVARACQTCHHVSEDDIRGRVQVIQDRTAALLDRGEVAVLAAIESLSAAKKRGATDEALRDARALHRRAQWRLDFISAENSMGFHAPQESARILAEALDYARQSELAALKAQVTQGPMAVPTAPAATVPTPAEVAPTPPVDGAPKAVVTP
jgi:nitrite reductase (cytochrome c-552)